VLVSGHLADVARALVQVNNSVGFDVVAATSLDECLAAIEKYNPRLLLLTNLPEEGEISDLFSMVAAATRRKSLPIIVEEIDWSVSFVPQYDNVELLPRGFESTAFIKAAASILFRSGGAIIPIRLIGRGCVFDAETLYASHDETRLPMRYQDFVLILGFVLSSNLTASREDLASMFWGSIPRRSLRVIDQAIGRCRKFLKDLGGGLFIVSVRGVGYKLSEYEE
jgi:DNA-binding response OmpR family regulator